MWVLIIVSNALFNLFKLVLELIPPGNATKASLVDPRQLLQGSLGFRHLLVLVGLQLLRVIDELLKRHYQFDEETDSQAILLRRILFSQNGKVNLLFDLRELRAVQLQEQGYGREPLEVCKVNVFLFFVENVFILLAQRLGLVEVLGLQQVAQIVQEDRLLQLQVLV